MAAPTTDLPRAAYRAEAVRRLDQAALTALGIESLTLMERAGAAAWEVFAATWPQARRLLVIAGGGNNGGDGYVVARLAQQAHRQVTVAALVDPVELRGDARACYLAASAAGVEVTPAMPGSLASFDAIVDALLGIGVNRALPAPWCAVIERVNASGVPVLAIDLPSGLDADAGTSWGAAVRANATVTFIGVKRGLLTGVAADYRGRLWYADLGAPPAIFEGREPDAELRDLASIRGVLGPRRRAAHKGEQGHVLVVGGERGYAGAVRMAAEAAARVGAGLVSLATRADHAGLVALARPELMAHAVEDGAALRSLLARADVVVIGPGLGQSAWSQGLLATVLDSARPLVVDADALNLLAREPTRRTNWVLTPHPGEAARLLGTDTATINRDRYAAVRALHARYGAVCVLKGAGTLVDSGARVQICAPGNPGMASGGMGDVLAGVIGALMGQGLAPAIAAVAGVVLHAAAADAAAVDGERGLLATDLLPYLRREVNRI